MLGRNIISIADLSPIELKQVLDVSTWMKNNRTTPVLQGKTLALVFEKPSLRTRVSFEVAMQRLGGNTISLPSSEIQMGNREPVKDVARVLARMVDVIAARTHEHSTITTLGEYSSVPVINALSDIEHPCQSLADLLTLKEHFGDLKGIKIAYIGEGNNVARSLAYASVMAGIDLTIACPENYRLPEETIVSIQNLEGNGSVSQTDDPRLAISAAAAVYTDVWASMGYEHELELRRNIFKPYQLNNELLSFAPNDILIMHDLPAHRGDEITEEIIESDYSIVFDQAENRMHAQQGLLALILSDSKF